MVLKRKKIIFSFVVFFILFFLIVIRAFYIQIINREKLISYSKGQLLREVKIYPNRGLIVDRNNKPLAINRQSYSAFVIPKLIKNKRKFVNQLAKHIKIKNKNYLLKRLKKRKRFTWIFRKKFVSKKIVEAIKSIDGIYVEEEISRYYPHRDLLSQTVGFVGVDNKGLSGIEFFFDKKLRGEPKIVKYLRDAKGRPLKFESSSFKEKISPITLSIDLELQAIAEKYIKEAVEKNEAQQGGFGIMNASNGEVLAIGNYPSFDPNSFKKFSPSLRKLSFISDPFEPGSVFKILTAASGLENEILFPDTSFYCEKGSFLVDGHVINEANPEHQYEWLTVEEIMAKSSNVGTSKMAFQITSPVLEKTLEKLPVGKKTGIELPGESRGIYNKGMKDPLSLSNLSFGQGVATTGVQMLSLYSIIANGGTYYPPTILKDSAENKEGTKIFEQKLTEKLTKMLVKVVHEGTGRNAEIPFFTIAGKTGTAQKAVKGKGYKDYVASFIGFPANTREKFVIFVYLDSPKVRPVSGNKMAAPVFKKMAQFILYKNKDIESIAKKSFQQNPPLNPSAKLKETPKSMKKNRILDPKKIPNFVGLDKISAKNLANKMGLTLNFQGAGLVTGQRPLFGDKLPKSKIVLLKLKAPRYE